MLAALAMDVTCERCGTEYEFDETLVSDRGTTVKCTNCGHLFKVFRGSSAGAVAAESAADARKAWTLRTEAGASRPIQSLKELQRLIAEGAVGEDDEALAQRRGVEAPGRHRGALDVLLGGAGRRRDATTRSHGALRRRARGHRAGDAAPRRWRGPGRAARQGHDDGHGWARGRRAAPSARRARR